MNTFIFSSQPVSLIPQPFMLQKKGVLPISIAFTPFTILNLYLVAGCICKSCPSTTKGPKFWGPWKGKVRFQRLPLTLASYWPVEFWQRGRKRKTAGQKESFQISSCAAGNSCDYHGRGQGVAEGRKLSGCWSHSHVYLSACYHPLLSAP